MDFPLEILNDVLSPFDKKELKALRLVCKSYEQAASQRLFDSLSISNNTDSISKAKSIINNFSSSVKTIIFCPIFYKSFTLDQYLKVLNGKGGRVSHRFMRLHQEHKKRGYATYCRLARRQARGRAVEAILIAAFSKCENALKLVLGTPAGFDHPTELDVERFGLSRFDLCPCPHDSGPYLTCRTPFKEHQLLFVRPEAGFYFWYRKSWYPAMMALSTTKSRITEIEMDSSGFTWRYPNDWNLNLSVRAFSLDAAEDDDLYLSIRQRLDVLTKLRLDIGLDTSFLKHMTCCSQGDVAKALSTARNLTSLYLCANQVEQKSKHRGPNSCYGNVFTPFEAFLSGCQFPKLRCLILQSFEVSQDDLLDLLQASPHLEALLLSAFSLEIGSWTDIAGKLRATLQLKKVRLQFLGYSSDPEHLGDWFSSHQHEVQNFFFHNGENPFDISEKEMLGCNMDYDYVDWEDRFQWMNDFYNSWNDADEFWRAIQLR